MATKSGPQGEKKAPSFERCPHCYLRFGSDTSLQAHVADHLVKFRDEMLSPEHQAVMDPMRHHAMLRDRLKRKGGHGR